MDFPSAFAIVKATVLVFRRENAIASLMLVLVLFFGGEGRLILNIKMLLFLGLRGRRRRRVLMDDNLRFLLLRLLLLIDRIRLVKLTEARVSSVIGLSLCLLLTLLFLVKSSLQVSDSVLSRDISRASCNSCRMTHERCLYIMHLLIIHMLK